MGDQVVPKGLVRSTPLSDDLHRVDHLLPGLLDVYVKFPHTLLPKSYADMLIAPALKNLTVETFTLNPLNHDYRT